MKRQRRYITFYKIEFKYMIPYVKSYGLMCTRSYWKCMKMGIRHIRQGKASLFFIEKVKPKKDSYFN